jgi:propionyl-CoA synthetase
VASFKNAVIVKRLPKTRSGKILRRVMSSIAGKEDYKTPATLDDPMILDEISAALFS